MEYTLSEDLFCFFLKGAAPQGKCVDKAASRSVLMLIRVKEKETMC